MQNTAKQQLHSTAARLWPRKSPAVFHGMEGKNNPFWLGGPVKRCSASALVLIFLLSAVPAFAEGFHLMDWGARGMGLAGGMVGRADDPSTLAYNAAGITQLPGTRVLLGGSTVTPYCSIEGQYADGSKHTTRLVDSTWTIGHGYLTHQLNDNVWLGLGIFSRFGTGVTFAGDWFGRYSMYDVGLQTLSLVPTVAYKFNEHVSVSLGIEAMYAHLYLGQRAPLQYGPYNFGDADLQTEGKGLGWGVHAGLHVRFNDEWSAGLAYKSAVRMTLNGETQLEPWGSNANRNVAPLKPIYGAVLAKAKQTYDSDVNGTTMLPDSLALGIAWKPLPNLSFEVGSIWSRWSSYQNLNFYFDSGAESINNKKYRDGINFNVSVEYSPLDWLTLRAGYLYETPVVNEKYADFIVPNYGRDVVSLGLGFKWDSWAVDLAWQHLWNHSLSYYDTRTHGIKDAGLAGASVVNPQSDAFAISVAYTF